MNLNTEQFSLKPDQYFAEAQPKSLIVLHFTAGTTAESAVRTWIADPVRVAVAYVVDKNGIVYECFRPEFWAYHLGIESRWQQGHAHHRRSIGIEIVNEGPLKRDPKVPDQLNWWPKDFRTKFCTTAETAKYIHAPYRGYEFFARYTDAQHDAVGELCRTLCERFPIPKKIPPLQQRNVFDVPWFSKWNGIASHQNCRQDKSDIGPAWDWARLEEALK